MSTPSSATGRFGIRAATLSVVVSLAVALATLLPSGTAVATPQARPGAGVEVNAGSNAGSQPPQPVTSMAANVLRDPTFNAALAGGEESLVTSLVVQPDGKVLVAGRFTYSANGTTTSGIARLNANGSLDTSFNAGLGAGMSQGIGLPQPGTVLAVGLQSNGRIVVGGLFDRWDGQPRGRIVRLLPNGQPDDSFNPASAGVSIPGTGFNQPVRSLAVQADGKIVVGGQFTFFNDTRRNGIARLNSDGTLDTGFDPGTGVSGGNSSVAAVAVQSDGRVLVGGDFTAVNGQPRSALARLTSSGAVDSQFQVGTGFGPGYPTTIAVLPNQRVVVGGGFSQYNGQAHNDLMRLLPTGAVDATFSAGAGVVDDAGKDAGVAVVLPQSDGTLLVGGTFAAYQGTARPGLARVLANGAVDPTFDPGAGFRTEVSPGLVRGGSVLALATSAGKPLVAGAFDTFNGSPVGPVVRLNFTPTAGSNFVPLSSPVRVYDSRSTGEGPVSRSAPRTINLTAGGKLTLSAGTTAVAYNLTVTDQSASGYATVTSAELITEPRSSSINWSRPKQTVANGHITSIDAGKSVKVFVGGTGTAEVIVDVVGFFQPGAAQGTVFVPIAPTRVLNTVESNNPLQPGVPRALDLPTATSGQVPITAQAVSFNLTVTGTQRSGFVAAAPGGAPVPTGVSTINWPEPSTTTANASVVRLGGGVMQLQADQRGGSTHAIVDVTGYFVAAGGAQSGALFYPLTPTRAYDSRLPGSGGALSGSVATGLHGTPRTTSVSLGGAIPVGAVAVAYNLTIAGTTQSGFAANAPTAVVAGTSSVNWPAANSVVANGSIVGLDGGGNMTTWVGGRGKAEYLIDLVGYFGP